MAFAFQPGDRSAAESTDQLGRQLTESRRQPKMMQCPGDAGPAAYWDQPAALDCAVAAVPRGKRRSE